MEQKVNWLSSDPKAIIVTGSAGFIGYHLTKALLARGRQVIGIDVINDYYDPALKYGRLEQCGVSRQALDDAGYGQMVEGESGYRFYRADIADQELIFRILEDELARLNQATEGDSVGGPGESKPGQGRFEAICNLAAQAGVRYSLENPRAYVESNISGFLTILEACRTFPVDHLIYASSSSVYGNNSSMPFSTRDNVDRPVSLYAASKKSNELMAYTYSHLFGIPATGLRFFTVYGPWGRPDMAYFLFTRAILEGQPIKVFNHGNMKRDFTYVDDIVEGMIRVMEHPPRRSTSLPVGTTIESAGNEEEEEAIQPPYRLYNIGKGAPVDLMHFIETIESALGRKAEKELLPMQPGDVPATWADTADLERDMGYRPSTLVEAGVGQFVRWYREFYGV